MWRHLLRCRSTALMDCLLVYSAFDLWDLRAEDIHLACKVKYPASSPTGDLADLQSSWQSRSLNMLSGKALSIRILSYSCLIFSIGDHNNLPLQKTEQHFCNSGY